MPGRLQNSRLRATSQQQVATVQSSIRTVVVSSRGCSLPAGCANGGPLPLYHTRRSPPRRTFTCRLFESGLSFSSPRHGPLVVPFRIHLAAVATYRLNCHDGCGLLLLRQYADPHSYGPLALLPARIGAEQPDTDAPPLTALTLALVIRSGSDLQRYIQDNVWSLWTQLFRELSIPCDDLAAPPAEIRDALAQYQREDLAA